MDGFGTIRLHHRTIKRFRGFSRKFGKSYSETMEAVMDFFEWHGILPSKRFADQINKEEQKTRKRVEAAIAIIRNIEKNQTLPTNIMLEALFGKHEIVRQREEPKLIERKFEKLTRDEWNKKEDKISRIKYDRLKRRYDRAQELFEDAVTKINRVEPRFGKPYYRIDIGATELSRLKRVLEKDY
ncbi:BfmA/BtgA family mobilization protein [Ulvibacterium sp.]|uniref:BfmA/BtgA family mobilization protein n=1 Tax=Ulvibacterium sp. TaxID=2665914 RepID=UPI002606C4E6|nr:BfmA/BtgA family mobilization protein [Ulvibacterium sp.]